MNVLNLGKKLVTFIGTSGARVAILAVVLTATIGTITFVTNQILDDIEMDFDPNAQVYSGEEPQSIGGSATGISIPGYDDIKIPANTQDINFTFLNPSVNGSSKKTYYLTFELILKDSGKSLWKSGKIRPGYAISNETLSEALSAGEYKAVVKTQPYTRDGPTSNSANMETKLIVE